MVPSVVKLNEINKKGAIAMEYRFLNPLVPVRDLDIPLDRDPSAEEVNVLQTAMIAVLLTENWPASFPEGNMSEHGYSRLCLFGADTPGWQIWLMRWGPGAKTPIHCHGRPNDPWGFIGVKAGCEQNNVYVLRGEDTQMQQDEIHLVYPGKTLFIPKGTIHEVLSPDPTWALHLYAGPISDKQRKYDYATGQASPM